MSATIHIAAASTSGQHAAKGNCSNCTLKQLCLPLGMAEADVVRLDKIIGRRRRVARDEPLFHVDQPFRNLYAVRFGHFKTLRLNFHGHEQITGFQMAGELLGMDGIGNGSHHCDAVALEDSEVCEIPYEQLEVLIGQVPQLLHHFHRIMSQEIMREQNVMQLLGSMRAEQRFAIFLLNLGARYAARGYSANAFQLRMSREDIGNYLGLTIESISRLISKFKKVNLIRVGNRDIELIDRATLTSVAAGMSSVDAPAAAPAPARQGLHLAFAA
ncbi:MAG: fumarate/nitrate reduction transcriptional regulator Fnr [Pseudomonadota bacterium]